MKFFHSFVVQSSKFLRLHFFLHGVVVGGGDVVVVVDVIGHVIGVPNLLSS